MSEFTNNTNENKIQNAKIKILLQGRILLRRKNNNAKLKINKFKKILNI
jgi:hypothetical protein